MRSGISVRHWMQSRCSLQSSVMKTGSWIKGCAEGNEWTCKNSVKPSSCCPKSFKYKMLPESHLSLFLTNKSGESSPLGLLNFPGFVFTPYTSGASFQNTDLFWMTYSNRF